MKIKNIVMSIATAATLSGAALAISTTQTPAQPVAAATTASKKMVVNYAKGYGIAVYDAPAGNLTGKKLASGTKWQVFGTSVQAGGQTWVNLGGKQWVQARYMKTPSVTKQVKNASGLTVYNAPAGSSTGKTLKNGTNWKVLGDYVSANGSSWANVGGNQWVQAQYLITPPVKKAAPKTVVQGPRRYMSATAYDPRVLGNYTFGYDTVAANLSVFPRGTRLKITFANGASKIYTVRDTGSFAYSNPNQLDLAMPNGQAMAFGRQNISVQVVR